MILEKVIQQVEIQPEYQELVDQYIQDVRAAFEDKIHSIYMCGSIPKGTAVPYRSDADFTIVCANPQELDYEKISAITDRLVQQYPVATKIDTTVCSLDNVFSRPYEWGFWVQVICVCVYGDDLGTRIPPLEISPAFIVDLNTDTPQEIGWIRQRLLDTQDRALQSRYIRGYSKRLMRALYSLVLEETGAWEDDLGEIKKAILSYGQIDPAKVNQLYDYYLNSEVPVEEFMRTADDVYRDLEHALKKMETSL
ncbi:nucleotidyltransferase [Saccharibacillus sp. O16]|nr:nucleotidyltransferase [Saccharibacillus sp. O16]